MKRDKPNCTTWSLTNPSLMSSFNGPDYSWAVTFVMSLDIIIFFIIYMTHSIISPICSFCLEENEELYHFSNECPALHILGTTANMDPRSTSQQVDTATSYQLHLHSENQ